MEIGERIRQARRLAQLTARELALFVDVAPSTVTRIENGERMPSYDLAVKLLRAANVGEDLQPLARPTAIATVRWLIDPDFDKRPDDADEWIAGWTRLGLLDASSRPTDLRWLLFRAGEAARLQARAGRVNVALTPTWKLAVERLAAGSVRWARTGDAAANRLVDWASEFWPVFYVEDVPAALQLMQLRPRRPDEWGPLMSFLPFDGWSEIGRWQDDNGMWYADPWQVTMDCFGGVQRMPDQADMILDTLTETG